MAIAQDSQASLAHLLEQTPSTVLQPLCFFVSWQGVLTIAYTGFPNALAGLKQRINERWPELPKENPGSLWPKTTLAPLRDGKRLTPENLEALLSICKRSSTGFSEAAAVPVRSAAVAVFACRSLEKCLSVHELDLRISISAAEDNAVSEAEKANVSRVVSEAHRADYWFAASKDGSRESHYRGPAFGSTVMIPIGAWLQTNERFRATIQAFQEEVDQALPGSYAWLDPASYHVTIRGICG